MNLIPPRPKEVIYPESDGKPLAENTRQCRWIFVLFGNIAALFRDALDVFVAADLLWYPVEGELVELGRKVRQHQAAPEELQELERLENESLPSP
jgi:hypothetical protein